MKHMVIILIVALIGIVGVFNGSMVQAAVRKKKLHSSWQPCWVLPDRLFPITRI